ncbi:MAG: T9SS type A sorting domain-containing protein [Bacteroidia bacterium]|nr:T9SS type A sorting domain-containing protein [Bacteroidia bacterium]
MIRIWLLFLILSLPHELLAQQCGTNTIHKMLQQKGLWPQNKASHNTTSWPTDSIYTIPVVIHVIYATNAQNVQDLQIESQVEVLNEDYAGLNLDAILIPQPFKQFKSGDVGIRFCLASVDPQNNPTTGITRTFTQVNSFALNDEMKYATTGGHDAWPTDKYLNIWVCNLDGNVLGYAQYPGGPPETDGVVIYYKAFGKNGTAAKPYNKGRTATHEVGHWLNLQHIWGDDGNACNGSDEVADTPNQANSSSGCPVFPSISCNNGPHGDMYVNYMDYTNDSCMFMFTQGQKERMQTAIENYRPLMKNTSTNCAPLYQTIDYSTTIIPNPSTGRFMIKFKNAIPPTCLLQMFDLTGKTIYSYQVSGLESRYLNIDLGNVSNGLYFLKTEIAGKTYVNKLMVFR